VNLAHLRNLPHGFDLPSIEGVLIAEGHVQGSAAGPSAEGTLKLRNGRIEQYGLGDADLTFALDEHVLSVPEGKFRAENGGGEVALSARLGLTDSLPLEAKLQVQDLEFHKLM